jgi:uncharacterized membrane protein YcfT
MHSGGAAIDEEQQMSRPARRRSATVFVVGFVLMAAVQWFAELPWWQYALMCALPYGAALWLAGREHPPRRHDAS